jgi:hypothetical protein
MARGRGHRHGNMVGVANRLGCPARTEGRGVGSGRLLQMFYRSGEKRHCSDLGTKVKSDATLIRVETDNGPTGIARPLVHRRSSRPSSSMSSRRFRSCRREKDTGTLGGEVRTGLAGEGNRIRKLGPCYTTCSRPSLSPGSQSHSCLRDQLVHRETEGPHLVCSSIGASTNCSGGGGWRQAHGATRHRPGASGAAT